METNLRKKDRSDSFCVTSLYHRAISGRSSLIKKGSKYCISKSALAEGYVLEMAEAFKSADASQLQRILEEKQPAIEADSNMGLAKQVEKWQNRADKFFGLFSHVGQRKKRVRFPFLK